ncbi:hypothetical protein [Billgrantia kenyensis]|uniref:Thymidylate kinase n=1 Tax=Billgrantia kenyensis TaxID=321266 RepID=A0A7V9W4Z9_9GAMM|nr:hypothetical protein [Halomonas kenyensis]MBA2781159.1 hypothetical protein [Halomonas kenyensis]MCG6663845.1 hypothetical protein [Halomonas kenyensis]
MKFVEFLGPSGVGKTTIFQKLLTLREGEDGWLTSEEARSFAVQYHVDKDSFMKKMASLVLRMNASPILSRAIIDLFMAKHELMVGKEFIGKYEVYLKLLIQYLQFDRTMSEITKCRFIEYYVNDLIRNVAALDYIGLDRTIIYHDGVVHNNPGFMLPADQLYRTIECGSMERTLPNGVIYISSNVDVVFKRRAQRIQSGKGNLLEANLSEVELYQLCFWSEKCAERQREVLKALGVKIIDLNSEISISEICSKARKFIKHVENNL